VLKLPIFHRLWPNKKVDRWLIQKKTESCKMIMKHWHASLCSKIPCSNQGGNQTKSTIQYHPNLFPVLLVYQRNTNCTKCFSVFEFVLHITHYVQLIVRTEVLHQVQWSLLFLVEGLFFSRLETIKTMMVDTDLRGFGNSSMKLDLFTRETMVLDTMPRYNAGLPRSHVCGFMFTHSNISYPR